MVDAKTSRATRDVESSGHEMVRSQLWDWRSWLIPLATLLGFAIPAVSYLWMIHAGSVNIIFADQWDDVGLIGHAFSGTLHFSMLWTQHNENRIFFPNLIVLALAYTTHYNVETEEYLSALMLFGATALVVCAHKRRSPQRRWIWYCPVAFLMLSLAQAINALWGFQMAWYLVLVMVALALFLLDDEPLPSPVFGSAIAAAVVASFSSLQGLLVWPAGLLLIYLRRRPRQLAVTWIGCALLAGVIYFVGFDFEATHTSSPRSAAALTFFLRILGDIVGENQPGVLVTLFGSVLVVTAIWVLIRFATRERTTAGGRPYALSLILFGLLVSALTAYGRAGLSSAEEWIGRYSVFALFVLVGLYLAVLDPPTTSVRKSSEDDPRSVARRTGGQLHVLSDPFFTLARVIVGLGIALTTIFGSANGITLAREAREYHIYLGQVTVRANQYSDSVVADGLGEPAQTVRPWISIARDDHLSLFDTGDAAKYLTEPPLYFAPLRAAVILPRNGSTIQGKQILDVQASGLYNVRKVVYVLSGTGIEGALVATGYRNYFGWLAEWNTSSVANGIYMIKATVSDSGGRSVTTAPVEVHVENVNRPGS
jgi:hypothetical protein